MEEMPDSAGFGAAQSVLSKSSDVCKRPGHSTARRRAPTRWWDRSPADRTRVRRWLEARVEVAVDAVIAGLAGDWLHVGPRVEREATCLMVIAVAAAIIVHVVASTQSSERTVSLRVSRSTEVSR